MAVPLVAKVVAGASATLYAIWAATPEAIKDIGKEEMERAARGEVDEYLKTALEAAFEKIGLDVDISQGITPQTITRAINNGPLAGTGIQLTNVFDKESCKRDLMRIGLQRAAEAYGVKIKDTSMEGLRDAIREHVATEIDKQIEAGAGPWLDDMPELVELARELASATARGLIDGAGDLLEAPVSMTPHHINLRERQARYAAKHKRQWVPK